MPEENMADGADWFGFGYKFILGVVFGTSFMLNN